MSQQEKRRGLSRRDFLKNFAKGVGATAVGLSGATAFAQDAEGTPVGSASTPEGQDQMAPIDPEAEREARLQRLEELRVMDQEGLESIVENAIPLNDDQGNQIALDYFFNLRQHPDANLARIEMMFPVVAAQPVRSILEVDTDNIEERQIEILRIPSIIKSASGHYVYTEVCTTLLMGVNRFNIYPREGFDFGPEHLDGYGIDPEEMEAELFKGGKPKQNALEVLSISSQEAFNQHENYYLTGIDYSRYGSYSGEKHKEKNLHRLEILRFSLNNSDFTMEQIRNGNTDGSGGRFITLLNRVGLNTAQPDTN